MREMIAGGKGEVKAWPSLPEPSIHGNKSKAPPAAVMYRGRDEGEKKDGKMEGLKVVLGGRKVFDDMEAGGWMCGGCLATQFDHTANICFKLQYCCPVLYFGYGQKQLN